MAGCITGCCHCSNSVSRCVQIICVLDMVASILFVVYETSNFGLLTGLLQPKSEWNCTNCTTLSEYIPESILSKFDFETYTVMSLIVLIFVGFIIEGSLYSKLKTGKRNKIHVYIKKWFEWRIVLLLITVAMAVAKYLRGFYTLKYDGILDIITKTYRVFTLLIVKCFMNELAVTVGLVYVKPPKPRKRGSLSLK